MRSLRSTLFILLVTLSVVISFGVGMVIYAQYRAYIKDTYEATLKQVLEGVSASLPVLSDPTSIIKEGHVQSETFTDLFIKLHTFTKLFNVEDIVLLDRQQGNTYRFLVGALKEGDPLSFLAEGLFLSPYEAQESIREAIEEVYQTGRFQVTKSPYSDEFGTHVTGILPLMQKGTVTAILAVDYNVSYVEGLHQNAYFALIVSMIFAVVLATVGAYVLATVLVKPINQVTLAAGELAQAHFDIQIPITTHNEIGGQQKALCTIRDNLKRLVANLNHQVQKLATISNNLKDAVKKSFSDVAVIVSQMNSVQNEADSQITMVAVTTDSTKRIVSHINDLDGA
ncbi:MAG: methyl-accepting chemotaxis protein, partial [Treponema sp.]|nr:methyl-accepting chemotaxis protein [Treponema sp.]